MPKTKFQDVIFTLLMVVVMVYALVVYNISLDRGGLTNEVFVMAFGELVIMGIAAFLLEMFLAGPFVRWIFRHLFKDKEACAGEAAAGAR